MVVEVRKEPPPLAEPLELEEPDDDVEADGDGTGVMLPGGAGGCSDCRTVIGMEQVKPLPEAVRVPLAAVLPEL